MGRIGILAGIIGIMAAAVIVRLFFLQVSRAEEYGDVAARQHAVSSFSFPSRGNIFFKDKEQILVPAAVTRRTYMLAGNPQKIEDPEALYNKLSGLVSLEKEAFLLRAQATTTYTVFLKDISREKAGELARLKIPGLWVTDEESRIYPEGVTASHALGFVGYVDNMRIGRYGVEQQYEEILGGTPGSYEGEQSQEGFLISFTNTFFSKKQDGYDVVLTIDPHIQTVSHGIVLKLMEEWHASSAGILVMQPQTGAILAMESLPGFDLNAYGEVKDYEVFLNPFTQKIFEMGSIVKPLTMAAGLDAHAISEETKYYDAGFVQIRDAQIKNYDGKGRGWQTMYDILDQSLNTGAVFVMQQLGARQFRDYMERYGLGSVTGVDLPQEIPGNLRNLDVGGDVEYATASFGQGIAVTPLGLATALSAVANGGKLMRPYIVDRVIDGDTVISKTSPVVRRRVIDADTSEIISRMLSKVVDDTLANGVVAMPGYHIAAKTGTAQISNTTSSGYSDQYLHAFFGYAPAFDPQFFILLYVEKPVGVRYASQTLSLPFRKLAEFIINYYEIPPDR